jgi:uroporphyrinogen-III synthase
LRVVATQVTLRINANNGAPMTPTLIVTRPAPQGEAFAQIVQAQWNGPLHVVLSPLIKIEPIQVSADLSDLTGIILTSVNGVEAAKRLQLSANLPAWCVGRKTGALARQAGFDPIIGPRDADALAQLIIKLAPTGPIAHIRGRHTRGDICIQLTRANIPCIDVVAYDQVECALNDDAREKLGGKKPVIFPLFSPRTATILSNEGSFAAPTYIVAMSNAVKAAVSNLANVKIEIAVRPDENAMVAATLKACTQTQGRD